MGESERELTLLHLRKTFSEYCRVPLTGADANTDRKFDRVLPLFCKVMTMYPCATDIVAQFKEICSFSGHLCRHLVQEMRVRAAELSTDHAALHIATFLSPVTNDSRGWLLLQSAHYLVSTGHLPVIDAVCKASLPSTLVKALYLFFDLPSTSDQKIIELRRMVFNRFLKLMEKLCEYKCVGEELARKDDLFLLFVGACCTCPVENVAWRKAASQLLVTLISKALTPAVIKYIHGKQCIAHFLSNISNEDAHLSVQERVEMIICLLCVIKDSASLTPVILQDFQQFNGYTILKQFVLNYEYEEDGIRNVLLMLMSVVTSGLVELRPLSSPSLVVLPSFTLPSPSGNGLSVRNLDAFRLLFQIFVECKNERICETVIDVVHNIYASDSANYFIIDRECSLAQFVENMHSKGTQVQRKILELLEYVVFHLNHVPCKELIALSVLLKTHTAAGNLSCCELSLQSAFRILSANTILKDAFREVGLVETFTWIMIHYVTLLKEQTLSDEQARIALLSTDILALSISGNNNNSRVFRESAGSKLLVDLICIDNGEWRASALQLIKQLLILAHSEEQLAALLMILHAPPNDSLELKSVILKSLLCVLRESHKVRVMFRRVGGYLCLISLLLSVEAKLHEPLQWHQDKPKTQSQQALATSSSESQPQVDESISAVANASVTSDQKLFKQQQPTAATNDNESTIRSDNMKGKENIYERNDNIDDDNDNNNNGSSDDDETNKLPQDCLGLLEFMHIIFKVLTISMRYEPSNAKYFSSEVKWDNLCIALRASGAFDDWSDCVQSASLTDEKDIWRSDASTLRSRIAACHRVFQHCEQIHSCTRPARMPASVFFACCILRFLFNMALDNYEKPNGDVVWSGEENLLALDDSTASIVSWTSSVLVHPGALLAILHLLPAIYADDIKWKGAAQLYTALIIKALLRPERNQQIMCQANMARSILKVGRNVFKAEKHLLLAPFYYVFERLSSHAITPTDLRHFLRLDMPLCCRNLEETEGEEAIRDSEGGPVPIGRVKALVSMMTPRDHRVAQNPSFVEFDMSLEGFACLLIPSLSPVASELGGVGHGERVFPPLNGLTVATWLYVEQFSDKRIDPHPVRLLSIFRSHSNNSAPKKTAAGVMMSGVEQSQQHDSSSQTLTCLTIQLSSIDRSLLICTSESDKAGGDLEKDCAELNSDDLVRVALADVICTRQWTHLAIVLTRSVLKHSQVSVYVNGRLHCSQKLHYVVQNVGGAATHLASTSAVHAIVGTPPNCRLLSRLHFKIASFFIFEEPLSADAIQRIYRLEPHYVGNFQTADSDGTPLVSEERICLALSAVADTELNVARIGSMYSKADAAFIAPFLGVSLHDHNTPLRVLFNTVSHAPGPARSFGAVLLGYLGMRTFAPLPVTRLLESVGGVSCLFGLLAMATDSQELYASLKALAAAVKTDKSISTYLNATRSYQTLAMLLEEKIELLNSHILHLILSLVGTVDTSRDTVAIPNIQTFEDLLCDVDVWRNVNADLSRLLYEHFYELITDQQRENLNIVRRSSLPSRLMIRLFDSPQAIFAVNDVVFNLIAAIIQPPSDSNSLLKLGQLLAATLPSSSADQCEEEYPLSIPDLQTALFKQKCTIAGTDSEIDRTLYLIYIRNRILNILANTLAHSSPSNNLQMSEQIIRVLGFDWALALFSPGVHKGTVVIGLRILLSLLRHEHLLSKFREGSANGGWLTDADSVVRNRAAVLLGFSVAAHGGTVGAHIDINPELSECSGFTALEHLLCSHSDKPQCYLAMLALLVGQPVANMTLIDDFSLDLIWSHVFGLSLSSSVSEAISRAQLCPEAIIPLLSMVRSCVHGALTQSSPQQTNNGHDTTNSDAENGLPSVTTNNEAQMQQQQQQRFAATVIQMLTFLYQNSLELCNVCHTDEFIVRLFSVLVPQQLGVVTTQSTTTHTQNPQQQPQQQMAITPTTSIAHSVLENACCRSVLDLLKRILCEDVSLSHSGRPDSLVDALIENVPECGPAKRFHSIILSEILTLCMEHMIATDVLLGSSRTATSAATNSSTTPVSPTLLLSNFAYFASRVVDCLWSALYVGEPMRVLDFLFKGIALGRRTDWRSSSPSDALLHTLDRAILYLLSRPIDTSQVQMCILDTLCEVVANRAIVLSPTHNDPLFFGALTHLLFMLSVTPDILPSERQQSQLDNGSAQVALCASRVWQEVCNAKRNILEDIFKRGFVCELNAARALLSHAASLQWLAFVDAQVNSSTPRNIVQIQQQIQSKITKVASGLQRLTSRKTLSTSSSTSMCASVWRPPNISTEVVHMWIRVHTSLIRELVRAQCVRYHEWHSHVQKWCLQEWHALEAELTRERGLWGPQIGSSLDKFALDTTEGPCRIRRKLIPNPTFYHQYPYRPHLDLPESKALRAKVAISKDSKLYYEAMKRRRSKTIDSRIVDQSAMINTPSEERGELLFADMQEVSMSMIQRVSIRHSDAGLPAASGGTAVAGRGGRKNGRSSSSTTGDAEREAEDEENGTSDTIAMTGSSEGERSEEVEAETETEASLLETANSSLMGAEKSEVDLDEEDDGGADEEDGVLVSDQSLIGNDSTDMSANATSSSSTANESTTRNDAIAAHHHNQVSKQKASEMSSSSSSTSHHHHQTSSSSLINNRQKRGPDNQTLLRLLEQGEQLHSMFRCARVQGLDTSEGLLLFGREHYYVVDGFTLLKTREIRDLDFLPQELHDPIVPYMACGATRPSRRTRLCSKFAYDDIREVHRRRYLLQPIAIEVFSADGRNYLLAFPKRMRNRVYQKLVSMAKALKDGGSESVSGQRSSVPVEQSGRVSLLTSIIGQQSVTQRWLRGEMSNFQYLMHLNTLAGRSYNDLSQYPIFPWILSDYDSEVLDLTNPRSFRNLSRPMGAQSAERLSQFLRRYREWDDPSGETPPYMYGTHYSSAMIVVSYLVRLEPFTQQFLKLQGGHFDLADRMFHSVADAWLSASRNNMADVKELIPEFFSLPEMFINSNHFDLGIKQNGITLDDVVLPRWAKGDPHEFVRIHRQALECDYVSANLHNWIDLIFGYKQCGEAAVESFNVYHHLFYEGNVDFENIDDPLTRNATIGFINNFGQIPTQLFKKPHPQKKVAFTDSYASTAGVTTQRLFYHSLDCLKVPQQPVKELKSAVGILHALEKGGVLALEANRVLLSANRYLSWGFPDRSIRIGIVDSEKSQSIHELCESAEVTCCACGDSRTLFSGSTMGTICVWNMSAERSLPLKIRPRRILSAHTEAITALLVCNAQTLLVSASRDCTAILWHLSALTFIRQLRPHPSAVTAIAVNDTTGDIATASSSLLFVWSINGQLLSVVNSIDSSYIEHIPNVVLAIAFSTMNEWDEQNVIMCGGSDGVVRIYSIEMVEAENTNAHDYCTQSSTEPHHATNTQKNAQPSITAAATLQQHLEKQRKRLRMGSSGSSLDTPSAESQVDSPERSSINSPAAVYECSSSAGVAAAGGGTGTGTAATDQNSSTATTSSLVWDTLNSTRKWSQQQQQSDVSSANNAGCRNWQPMLVPRASLTTHTAFFRKDNLRPAPITAIAPSKDHKSLFVGDGVGRVWQWQMGDEIGSRADHWVQDPSRSCCTQCQQRFSIAERRHHCRNCGHIFCSRCSRFESDIKHMKITKPVRVCQGCYLRLKAQGT